MKFMKRYFKFSVVFALVAILGKENAFSQNVQNTRTYRVIAYKAGNPGITSMSNETVVIPTMYIYVPNSFTPNNDGLNDTFGVSGEAIQKFDMQIYNRWGDLIFESANASQKWDGTFKGSKVPEGIYVYKISASGISGKNIKKDGTVTVIL
jgi:gliding motility-associated-like protein